MVHNQVMDKTFVFRHAGRLKEKGQGRGVTSLENQDAGRLASLHA